MYELVLAIHFLFVVFMMIGLLGVLLYFPLKFMGFTPHMLENTSLRLFHLLGICFVALESVLGIPCPLTFLEWGFAPQTQDKEFIARLLHESLYYDLPNEYFTVAYVLLALIVLCLNFLIPLNRKISLCNEGRPFVIHLFSSIYFQLALNAGLIWWIGKYAGWKFGFSAPFFQYVALVSTATLLFAGKAVIRFCVRRKIVDR